MPRQYRPVDAGSGRPRLTRAARLPLSRLSTLVAHNFGRRCPEVWPVKRLALVLFGLVAIVLACGPGFRVAVFSFQRHPDLPRSSFINGELGVLRPTYARSYLVL